MNWPEKQTPNMLPPPDTILHIGAGRCTELDTWRQSGASRIVLVEPNPELLPELRRRTQGVDQVEIIPAAIAEDAGRESLYLFNFPLLNSLHEPTGLRSMLPGLQQTGRAMVETRRLATLVDELPLDPNGRHRLIIDAPGMEAEIVDQLIADDLASTFTAVDITAGREPWYQGSQPLEALIERLEQAGYEPGATDSGSDPDWPRATFRYSRHAAESRRLAEEIKPLQERLRSQNEEFSRRFAELSRERDEAKARLESEQKNARTAAEENGKLQKQNEELTDELEKQKEAAHKAQKQLDSICAERDELKAAQARLEQEHTELKQSKDELQEKLESEQKNARAAAEENEKLQGRNKELTGELESLKEAAQEAQEQIDSIRTERDELKAARERLEDEYAELKQSRDELQTKLESEQKNARAAAEQNEKLQGRNKELSDELKDLKDAVDEAQEKINSIRTERDELESRVEQAEEKIESLENKLSDATEDAQDARSDLAVAIRLQTLRENDLKELQQRYGKLRETNEQQRELLAKLHQRLSAAADYLRLNSGDEETRTPEVEQLVRALTGSRPEDQ